MPRYALVVVLLLTLTTSVVAQQNPYLLDVYGDGVHAFHRGELPRAYEQFNKAINNGSRDPRVFYYRALYHMQNGNQGAADQDIRTGVTFELRGDGSYDIGTALTRVQGPHRIQFEDARLDLKLAMGGRQSQPPYTAPPYMDPSAIDARPLADDLPLKRGPAVDDPFQDDEQDDTRDGSDLNLDDTMGDDSPTQREPDDDPFGAEMSDAAGQPADSADDPFGEPADSVDDSDPFGEPADSADDSDPFGNGAADSPAGDDPFADDPADDAVDDDPFG